MIYLFVLSMIFSESRFPFFRIMLWSMMALNSIGVDVQATSPRLRGEVEAEGFG
jgi:hypothetical protein